MIPASGKSATREEVPPLEREHKLFLSAFWQPGPLNALAVLRP
jgi:hypothetical protein